MTARQTGRVVSILVGGATVLCAGYRLAVVRAHRPPSSSATAARLVEGYGRLPLSFEPNVGQTNSTVDFLARARGGTVFLSRYGATLVFRENREQRTNAVDS